MLQRAGLRIFSIGGRVLETVGRARMQRFSPLERAQWLHQMCVAVCEGHGFIVDREGSLPRAPSLLVANHLGYIDPLVIGSLVPCAPLAKAEIADWPIVGAGSRAPGVMFVRRGDVWSGARALRASLRCLEAGVSVLGFPEGTTARGTVLPFARGLFGVARMAGVPVVPVAISYDHPDAAWLGDTWFLPHYLRTAMRPLTRARVRIGAPFAPHASAEELEKAARAQIMEMCQ